MSQRLQRRRAAFARGRFGRSSFGNVLDELLAGTRAFTSDSTAQVLSAVLRDDPGPFAPTALSRS